MKKLSQIVAVAVIALTPFAFNASASAQAVIEDTGPGSNNEITTISNYECSVENKNKFEIKNKNTQEAVSGTATVSESTSGGQSSTGSATNSNGTVFNVTVTNGPVGTTGQETCVVTAITPATPVAPTPVKPTTPASPAKPTTPQARVQPTGGGGATGQFAALPTTSGDQTLAITATAAGIATLLAAIGVGGTLAYRRSHNL